jgi:hypothetical protein
MRRKNIYIYFFATDHLWVKVQDEETHTNVYNYLRNFFSLDSFT